jgi:hypothetical protein
VAAIAASSVWRATVFGGRGGLHRQLTTLAFHNLDSPHRCIHVDDIQRLILEVVGEEKLKILNEQLGQEKQLLLDLATGLRTNAISQAAFDQGAQATAKTMAQLNQQIRELQSNARGASAQGLLQMQYIMDDLINTSGNWERHLASISNNIPGLVQSAKGLGPIGDKIASWAGPIGIVATGLIALAPAARAAWEAISDGKPKEALDDLAERAKRVTDELKKLRESVTSEESETRKGYEGLMAGVTPDVERGIAAGLVASGSGAQMTAAESGRLERARQDMRLARSEPAKQAAEEQMRNAQLEIQAGINKRNAQLAGEMAAQIPTNANIRQKVRGFAQAQPGVFPNGFASDMAALEPERMRSDEAEADAWEAQVNDWADQGKRRRERLAREKRAKAEADRKKKEADRKKKHDNDEVDRIVEHFSTTGDELDTASHREAIRAQRDLERQMTPAAQRRRKVDDYAQRMSDFNQRKGWGLGDDAIQRAASQAVDMVQNGANVNQALMSAFDGQIRKMQALSMQLQQQVGQINMMQARARGLGMGPDQSGQYSYLPPALGY